MSGARRVAYLSSVYPRATDSFVREEVGSLREMGFEVETFSVRRPPPEQLTTDAIRADVSAAWEVLGEAVQTVMRRYGIPDPYEKLKELTRGQAVTKELLQEFISTLDIPAAEKERLASLTPEAYVGLAADLANDV